MQVFLILIFISYYLTGFQITSVMGYGITGLDIILVFFYAYILKRLIWDGEELKFSFTPILIFLLLLIAAVMLSAVSPILEGQSSWIIQYFKSFAHFIFLVFFALICAVMPIDLKKWMNIIRLLLYLSVIINLFGIYQIIARAYDLPLAWISLTNVSFGRGGSEDINEYKQLSLAYGNFFRATSIFSEPSALGAFNTYIISFLLIPFVFKFKHFIQSRFLLILMFISCAAASLFTFSMTAFVGFACVVGAIIVAQNPKKLFRFAIIAVSFIVIIVIADMLFSKNLGISVVELFSKRIEGIVSFGGDNKEVMGESFSLRLKGAFQAFDIWKEYPLTGIGLGSTYLNKINNLATTDMSFFSVLAETGIFGAITYLLFFFSMLFASFRLIKAKIFSDNAFDSSERRMMYIPFFIMTVQVLINFISGNNFILFNFWGFIAIVVSIINFAYTKKNLRIVRFRLVKTPIKLMFSDMLNKNLNKSIDI